jgi:coenzyme PQQ precursor peptide PqqA
MKLWHTPDFEEIRMDAEINCYCSVLKEDRLQPARSTEVAIGDSDAAIARRA